MDWIRRTFAPNRLAVYAAFASGLAAAIVPPIEGVDWRSTVSIVAGLGTIFGALAIFLKGWQAHEERQAVSLQAVELAEPAPEVPTDVPAAVVVAAKPAKKATTKKAA